MKKKKTETEKREKRKRGTEKNGRDERIGKRIGVEEVEISASEW